mmetsp:Transcript_8518/g.17325  ORF Transcript_8518/g.17325 Transcript_8518/m.17325 type:complete len:460 (-) Transcript_8518:178-1557(-)
MLPLPSFLESTTRSLRGRSSGTTKRPRAGAETVVPERYLSVNVLCIDKCWDQLASRILPPPSSRDERRERGLVADLLSQLNDIGLPVEVMVAIVSLSHREHRPLHHCDDDDRNSRFKHWPLHSLPATRHSLRRCRSAACEVHLSMIFEYLSSRRCASGAKRKEVVRLLTAILYLTSDDDTLEKMLCLVFDATLIMEESEDEGKAKASECTEESKVDIAVNEMNDVPMHLPAPAEPLTTARLKREKSVVLQRGEFVASKIGDAANWVSCSLEVRVVPTVNNGIDHAGKFVKKTIPPAPEPIIDRHTAVVTKTYTDAVRRSTHGIRNTAQVVSSGVREGATSVVKIVGECIADEATPENMDEEQKERRELLAAAGTVGMATFGAVALVGESIIDSSKAVVQKSAHVTADIVRHRHGDDAGAIVQDVFESTGNVVSITRTSFQATHISKAATKNIAKMHVHS